MTDQDGTAQRSLEDRQSEAGETEALHEDEDHEAVSRPPAKKEAAPPAEAKPGETPAPKKRPWVRIILILVALAAVIGGVTYWFLTRNEESTDDAYTDGRAVAIASHVSGYVTALNVRDNQFVHKGDVLVEIDPRDYIAARDQAQGNLLSTQGQLEGARYSSEVARKNFPARLGQAQAQLQAARATLFKAQNDYNRQHSLPKGATTQQEVDAATAALQSAQGQVAEAEAQVQQATPVQANIGETDSRVDQLAGIEKQAQAQLDQANLNLQYTRVTAAQSGRVVNLSGAVGTFTTAGQSLMMFVPDDIWVVANYKETQLRDMRPGQPVELTIDGYPGRKLTGRIASVQPGSGTAFSLLPAENATGNYVKVVQRVPVKIVVDHWPDDVAIGPGMSVVPWTRVR